MVKIFSVDILFNAVEQAAISHASATALCGRYRHVPGGHFRGKNGCLGYIIEAVLECPWDNYLNGFL